MGLPIPSMLLKQLYTRDSLRNTPEGVRFSLKNRLSDSTVTALYSIKIDDAAVPRSAIMVELGDGSRLTADEVSRQPVAFPLRRSIDVICAVPPLDKGMHKIEVKFDATPFGTLTLKVDSAVTEKREDVVRIPRDPVRLYHPELPGLFPSSEGAGYAGGIVSAALDGIKVARALAVFLGR